MLPRAKRDERRQRGGWGGGDRAQNEPPAGCVEDEDRDAQREKRREARRIGPADRFPELVEAEMDAERGEDGEAAEQQQELRLSPRVRPRRRARSSPRRRRGRRRSRAPCST